MTDLSRLINHEWMALVWIGLIVAAALIWGASTSSPRAELDQERGETMSLWTPPAQTSIVSP